ncbi:MAG TPA: SRPBCC domain-containing protein [Polyangiaceae bacterium]|nr:SRPBCC domain-containing protein [Polyangiaceae bacterium]
MVKPATAIQHAADVARAITDGELVLAQIDLPALPERVFSAMMTKECERWWGAAGVYTIENWKAELRLGGGWSLIIRLPDGTALPASGAFLDVTPAKVRQTRRYDFDHPTLGRRETEVTTHFQPLPDGTRVIVRHEGFGSTEAAIEHAGGWERMLDWLAEYLRSKGNGTAQ